jgi:glycolate oxidase FAD binding subunit
VQSLSISSGDVEVLGQLLMKILDSHLSTQSLQLRSNSSGFALDVRLSTLPEVIRDQASSLSKLAQSVQLEASDSDSDAWNARQEHFDQTEYFVVKATMLPSDISRIAATIHTLGGTSVTQAMGIMTACIPAAASSQLEPLRENLEAGGGSLIVLHHPADAAPAASTVPSDTLPLMRELKHRFDPNRILNPGHFPGGI